MKYRCLCYYVVVLLLKASTCGTRNILESLESKMFVQYITQHATFTKNWTLIFKKS